MIAKVGNAGYFIMPMVLAHGKAPFNIGRYERVRFGG